MAKRRSYTLEQTITKLRKAEVYLNQGKTVGQACKALEVSEQTFYLSLNTILNREKLRLQENILNVPVNINGYIV